MFCVLFFQLEIFSQKLPNKPSELSNEPFCFNDFFSLTLSKECLGPETVLLLLYLLSLTEKLTKNPIYS